MQQLNGSKKLELIDLSDRGEVVVNGKKSKAYLSRFACAMVGAILGINRTIRELAEYVDACLLAIHELRDRHRTELAEARITRNCNLVSS